MFEIGFAELFLLGVIALLVVGPDRLPALARTVGVWVGRAQRLVGQVRADIEREVRADELRKAAKEYSPTAALSDMKKEMDDFASEVSKPVDLDGDKAESAKSGTSDPTPTGLAAAPASDAADTSTAPEPEPAEPEAGLGEPLEAERAESEPAEPSAVETNEALPGALENGEPEHTHTVDSRPADEPEAQDGGLTNGRAAVETAATAVTEGPETTPTEQDERSAAP